MQNTARYERALKIVEIKTAFQSQNFDLWLKFMAIFFK